MSRSASDRGGKCQEYTMREPADEMALYIAFMLVNKPLLLFVLGRVFFRVDDKKHFSLYYQLVVASNIRYQSTTTSILH